MPTSSSKVHVDLTQALFLSNSIHTGSDPYAELPPTAALLSYQKLFLL